MPTSQWGLRAKVAGLDQKTIARLTGAGVDTISRGLTGKRGEVPLRLRSLVVAWELMTETQRAAWLAWLGVHLLFLVGMRNKFSVLMQWAYSYFTYKRGARIITGVSGEKSAGSA